MRRYLIHYSEISLKGKNRHHFEDRLIRDIYSATRGLGVQSVRRLYGRFVINQSEDGDAAELERRLARVHGIAHFDPVEIFDWDLDAVRAALREAARQRDFATFAMRARRLNKDFPHRSADLNRELGALVEAESGARVDLDAPERVFHLLALNKDLLLFHRRFEGPGGLPAGVAGKIVVLLSGGIDSPVAAARLMRRGCIPVFVHFHSSPFTDRSSVDKALELAQMLCEHRIETRFYAMPIGLLQQAIVAGAPARLRVLLYRRYMLRLAGLVARKDRCLALATGDSLGQVASQTLQNLCALDGTVPLPILRPLVAFDKQQIVDEARALGTYEVSIEPHSDCCSYLEPRQPATTATAEELENAEAALDVQGILDEIIDRTEQLRVGVEPAVEKPAGPEE